MQQHAPADHPLIRWQETIWLLLALLIPLFVNFWVEQQFEASKVWLLRALVWILALLWLGGWMMGARARALPTPIRNLIILLALIITLSTFLSANHAIAIFGTLDRANGYLTQLCYLLLFCCVATQINSESSQRLLFIISLTAVPICLLGLAQAAGWQPFAVSTDARSLITTTLGRANFSGAYLALLLPLTLAAAQQAAERWQRIGYASLVGLEIIIIALTKARAAWIAAAVGLGVLLWLHRAPRWSRQVRWFTTLGGLTVLAGSLLLLLPSGIPNGGSIAARWTIWQATLRLLWSRLWLGYGADTLELYFPSVYPPQLVYYQGRGVIVDRAHNWLLDWSFNYGIVATIVFLTLVGLVLHQGWKQLAMTPDATVSPSGMQPLDNNWLAACMAGICTQLVGNLFLFEVAATATVFWLLLAIVTAATAADNKRKNPVFLPLWVRRGIIVAAGFVVGWAVWQSSVRPLLADVHSWRGTLVLNQGNPGAALAEYRSAASYQPQRAAYHVAMALTAAQLEDFDQAERSMGEAIALRPSDPVLYTQLAAVYARGASAAPANITLAYEAYERAITLASTVALTYQQYADLALRFGDMGIALEQAQKAVSLDATDGIAFGIIGWSQLQAGNSSAAHSAFEQAVRWQPDSADFHLGLATAYFQQGRTVEAHQALQRSLALDPDYAPALTLRLQLSDN